MNGRVSGLCQIFMQELSSSYNRKSPIVHYVQISAMHNTKRETYIRTGDGKSGPNRHDGRERRKSIAVCNSRVRK